MTYTTIQEIILNIDSINEYSVVFAKRIEGQFKSYSESIILELTEKELELPIKEIADAKCPGFDYFLEIFLIKEILNDIKDSNQYNDFTKKVERIIRYVEFDV